MKFGRERTFKVQMRNLDATDACDAIPEPYYNQYFNSALCYLTVLNKNTCYCKDHEKGRQQRPGPVFADGPWTLIREKQLVVQNKV